MSLLQRTRAARRAFLDPSHLNRPAPPPPPPREVTPPFPKKEAEPCRLVTEVLSKFESIPGFFNEDDCMHFYLILEMQSLLDIKGDLFEIGSYFGQSTSLLAYCLKPSEKLVVCDAFRTETEDAYSSKPSTDDLKQNLLLVNPRFDLDRLEIHCCLSQDLPPGGKRRFRFAHVDGGHDAATAYHDLCLVADQLLPGGIIAVDDYKHPDWPGVSEAVGRFLAERSAEFRVLADMNRHIAKGRKLYLALR